MTRVRPSSASSSSVVHKLAARRPGLMASAGGTLAIGLVATALVLVTGVCDPDRPVREVALRDVRAAAELDLAQVWRDYSPCFQRRNPEASFIAEAQRGNSVPVSRAPADTHYSVVAVRPEGRYRRVEVRAEAPGYPVLDYEIDLREYDDRWVVVDRGALGHVIHDDCVLGGAG